MFWFAVAVQQLDHKGINCCQFQTTTTDAGLPLFALLVHGLILNKVSACSLLGGSYYRRLQRRLRTEENNNSLSACLFKTLSVVESHMRQLVIIYGRTSTKQKDQMIKCDK